jgi:terminase large subunit-like protein
MATTDPIELIAESLILPNDQPYGKCWESWQRQFFQAIFATVQDKKRLRRQAITRPRFRLCYSERRRGESKTEDCAAAALADLLTGPDWHRSYVVAADTDQAALVIDSIRGFQARSPILTHLQVMRNVVLNPATNAELRIMSSDDRTAYGIRPFRVWFDELSLQPDERLWTAMWSAIGKSPLSQMVAVSMAGWDFASFAWRVREQAASSEDYYFHTREGSELAPWLSERDMTEQRATLHPADFARFWECKWTEPKGSWITREMYAAAETGRESHTGHNCVGFVDVGLVHDPTAIAVVHQQGERVVLDTLRTLQGSRNEPVQLEAVEDLVSDLTRRFGVKHWTFESPQAVASVQRLQAKLRGTEIEARYPTVETQARLFGGLYQLFANHRLVLYPHEQLRKEALALVTKTVGGRLKVVESSSVHQDHVVALGGAADLIETRNDGPMVITRQEWSSANRRNPDLNPYEQISYNPFDSWPLEPD